MILNKGRVLLVDDEPLVLEMFESILSQEGYDVFVAPNAKEALFHLERTFFDVLVCDVMLEDLDGFDIMHISRKKHPEIAIVLITGAPTETDSERARLENASYLSKPIGFDLLVSSVEVALDANRNRKKRAQM
jgi:DNA-binding response OmpR family regulator